MRILLLDIETAPHISVHWGLWDQNISPDHIVTPGYTMCYAAKWFGEKEMMFDSVFHSSKQDLARSIHALLSEADAVVHYNGTKFDIPMLNTEIALHDLPPPPPYKEIDLLLTVRKRFRFPSNKLDYVSKRMGMGRKVKHKGMPLWMACMNMDPDAWKEMERYNRQDVTLLEKAYKKFLPWIKTHPNRGLYDGGCICSKCGSKKLQRRGWNYTKGGKYPRFQCNDCHGWSQGPAEKGDKQPMLRAA